MRRGRNRQGQVAATPRHPLDDLYARVPPVGCKGLCQDSCGPIAMSVEEEQRIRRLGVEVPPLAEALAALERGEDYYCPALVDERCSVYAVRPMVCRLWGATVTMPCPHGCGPDEPLTRDESHHLLRLAAEAGGGMGDGFTGSSDHDARP